MRGQVVLMIDAEGEFSRIAFHHTDPLRKRLTMRGSSVLRRDYGEKTFEGMLRTLEKHRVPVTVFLVGALYLKEGEKRLIDEYLERRPRTRYLYRDRRLIDAIPAWGSLVERWQRKGIEWGVHNFLHEDNAVEDEMQIARSLAFSVRAANLRGIVPRAYSAPWFEIERRGDGKRVYRCLKKVGFRHARFDGMKGQGWRLADHQGIEGIGHREGISYVKGSHFIASGKAAPQEIMAIRRGIGRAAKIGGVYAISTHDTTFLRHGLKRFEKVVNIIADRRKEATPTTLGDVAKKLI